MQINKQEKSPIKQRILQYIEYKCITKYKFYKDSGITRNILDQPTGISEDNLAVFLKYAQDISPIWLIFGEGEMLKKNIEGNDVGVGVKNKKNEHQDKKKCHDTQNNFNEKNASPILEFCDEKNASPIWENASPICKPNSEIGSDNANCFKLPMASEEPDSYRKVDTKNERFRELLDGGGIKEMLELKDALIGSQKAHIAALEAQLRDYRENITDLRRDLQELKKINKPVDHRFDGTTKDYTSSWDDVKGKKKR